MNPKMYLGLAARSCLKLRIFQLLSWGAVIQELKKNFQTAFDVSVWIVLDEGFDSCLFEEYKQRCMD